MRLDVMKRAFVACVRITCAAALGMVLCGGGGQAAASIVLNTPAGLNPGDQFRFVFVTDGTTNGISSNISDYDAFVNNDAAGATYNGAKVSWLAIGSTATVNAIDHIGQTNTKVYLAFNGALVASSTTSTGLWSGSITNAISHSLTADLSGQRVWTGTQSDGTVVPVFGGGNAGLGSSSPAGGDSGSTNSFWAEVFTSFPTFTHPLYGISEVLTATAVTAVPEPGSLALVSIGAVGLISYGWRRRQRAVA